VFKQQERTGQRPGTQICLAGKLRGDGIETSDATIFLPIVSRIVTMHLAKSLEPNVLS
jgi:hypothetical protein